ncbi:MAG: WecB/TagA/CpsF family glycosyltransferase [Ruminococcaceae bacterium]|nr:WecB/TagA/CpsF family glycosyltransferase [Oscillospiraceae bacterium]
MPTNRSTKKVKILTLNIPNLSEDEAKKKISNMLKKRNCAKIYTPNPQMALGCKNARSLTALFKRADLLLPDGIGLIIASHILKDPLKERITGIDTAEFILSFAEKNNLSVALLGAKPNVATLAKKRLKTRFPSLDICFTHHGYFEKSGRENEIVLKKLNFASPDILFVCFGFPAQEKWIDENAKKIASLRVCMGLGGALDVWSGKTKRAPKFVQRIKLEWLWRTLSDKQRYHNFSDVSRFLFLIFLQRKNKKY